MEIPPTDADIDASDRPGHGPPARSTARRGTEGAAETSVRAVEPVELEENPDGYKYE